MEIAYKILFLVIIPEIMASFYDQNTNYCGLRSCPNPRAHTFCVYARDTPGYGCNGLGIVSNQLTGVEKAKILRRHNQLRQFVASGRECRGRPGPQPAALDMKILEWDNELASIAQTWANQCPHNLKPHDQCRDVARFKVGQNMVQIDSNVKLDDVIELVDQWYLEVRNFDRRVVHNYRYEVPVGHYAQLVWANTSTIGCGRMTTYNRRAPPTERYSHVLICNYGAKGVNVGYPVYQASSQSQNRDCYTSTYF